MNKIKNFKIITLSLFTASSLYAVDIPNSSTIQKEIKTPKNIKKNKDGMIEIDGIETILPPLKDDKSGKTIFVKDFTITGNTNLSDSYLQNLLGEFKNKDLSFNDLQNVATVITKAYRDEGYFVARAYIPVQSMKDGIISIAVIEGKFGELEIKNSSRVKDSIIQGIFNEVEEGTVINSATMERLILIANDTPGVAVSKADVKPGAKTGYSDFEIETTQTPWYDGYIIYDNYGSRYTGKNRMMVGGNFNSPFKIGDQLSLVGLVSDGADLKYADIGYDTLLTSNGLRGGIGYSYTKYELAKEYKDLDAIGTSKIVNFNLSYPLIKQRDESLYVNFDFDNKKLNDKVNATNNDTKKEINVATASLEYSLSKLLYTLPTSTSLSLDINYGNLSFKDDTSFTNDQNGAKTSGNYTKLLLSASEAIALTPKITLEGTFTYQHALNSKNLDGSEDLSIGGSEGVKVYPTSEASAENGYIVSLEAKYLLPTFTQTFSNSVGIFYDRAKAYMEDTSTVSSDSIDLQDIGLSYYATYKDFFLNSYMAWRLNSDEITSEPDYNSKFLVQAGWVF